MTCPTCRHDREDIDEAHPAWLAGPAVWRMLAAVQPAQQDHRGIKQRSYMLRGLGNVDVASRCCRAFAEQRQSFRLHAAMRQRVPPLSQHDRSIMLDFKR